MRTVSVSILKAKLGEYLRLVKRGEGLLVTERGKIIAKITPERPAGPPDERRLEEMAKAGLLRRPVKPLPKDFFKRELPADPEGWVLRFLLEDREEGR